MARRKGRKRSSMMRSGSGGKPHITKVRTFKGRGKLSGRTCVRADLDKPHRSAVPGVKLKPVEYHGCYVSPRKAAAKVAQLERRVR